MNGYETVLVTGASSGIGAAVVRALAAAGLTVHAVARRADRLADLAEKTGCQAHAFDATDTAALTRLLDGLAIDILVNNVATGLGFGDRVAEVDPAVIDQRRRHEPYGRAPCLPPRPAGHDCPQTRPRRDRRFDQRALSGTPGTLRRDQGRASSAPPESAH